MALKASKTQKERHHCLTTLRVFNTEKRTPFLPTFKVSNAEKGLHHFLKALEVFNNEKGLQDFLTTLKVFNIEKGLHPFLMT